MDQDISQKKTKDETQGASESEAVRRMRSIWDDYARRNPMFYIHSKSLQEEFEWSPEEFFATGRAVETVVQDLFPEGDYASGRLLEIGCGLGRESIHLAQIFGEVVSLDISEEMVEQARRLHSDVPNLSFVVGDGHSLSGLADESFDYVYSFIVLQHITDHRVVLEYLREGARVLRPGGAFVFQLFDRPDGSPDSDHPWTCTRPGLTRVRHTLLEYGVDIVRTTSEGTAFMWVASVKRT